MAPFPKAKEYQKLKIGAYDIDKVSYVNLDTTDEDSDEDSDGEDGNVVEERSETQSEEGGEEQESMERIVAIWMVNKHH